MINHHRIARGKCSPLRAFPLWMQRAYGTSSYVIYATID